MPFRRFPAALPKPLPFGECRESPLPPSFLPAGPGRKVFLLTGILKACKFVMPYGENDHFPAKNALKEKLHIGEKVNS